MSGAAPEGKFQDHYEVLGVTPKAEMSEIHQAYSKLAEKYRPDNKTTADAEKFKAVNMAYEILSDPAARKIFDEIRPGSDKDGPPVFHHSELFETLATEGQRRLAILCVLYDRRRLKPMTGCISVRHMEHLMNMPGERLQLSIWYLKQRGLVTSDDKSNLQITVEGMDYLEAHLPPADSILALVKATQSVEPPPQPEEPPKPQSAPVPVEVKKPAAHGGNHGETRRIVPSTANRNWKLTKG
jgi:hypothetical protein